MSYRSTYSRQSYLNRPAYAYGERKTQVQVSCNFANPKWVAYKAVQPVRAAWIEAKAGAPNFNFPGNMYEAVIKFGDLTEKQGETVDRLAAKDSAPRAPQAASVTFPNIRAAFDALILNGGRKPITIGDVIISVAPSSGVNAGSLYVKVEGTYCGKIMPTPTGPIFRAVRECPADVVGKLQAIESDPKAAVKAHADKLAAKLAEAQARGETLSLPCGCCGITLTDPVSVARGIGPICAGRWGF